MTLCSMYLARQGLDGLIWTYLLLLAKQVGITMVGASSLLGSGDSSGSSDSKKVILGMGLIVFAQASNPPVLCMGDIFLANACCSWHRRGPQSM